MQKSASFWRHVGVNSHNDRRLSGDTYPQVDNTHDKMHTAYLLYITLWWWIKLQYNDTLRRTPYVSCLQNKEKIKPIFLIFLTYRLPQCALQILSYAMCKFYFIDIYLSFNKYIQYAVVYVRKQR